MASQDGFYRIETHCVPGWFLAFWDTSCPGMVFRVLRHIECPGMVLRMLRYIECPRMGYASVPSVEAGAEARVIVVVRGSKNKA